MILFSSVGHGLIEAIRQGFPIRVGALADRVRPPLLAGEGRGGNCASQSEVNRSARGAVGGASGLSGKPYPCNDEFETGGHLGGVG